MYHIFLIHSSVNGHIGFFHDLATVDSGATNLGMCMIFLNYSFFLDIIIVFSRHGIARSYGNCIFSFRNLHTVFHSGRDIVQEAGIKTMHKKKKCKKANWLSEEALQIDVKRREAKSRGRK